MTTYKKIDSLELSKEILDKGNRVRIPVVGSSMYPLFKKGNIIFIEPIDVEHTSVGDIIVCQRGDRMYAHRLMKKYIDNGRTVLVTKGDTFSDFDDPLYSENVLGKVVAIEKKGRRIMINEGLYGAINIFCAKLSPFSKWIYPLLRKIRHNLFRKKRKIEKEYLVSLIANSWRRSENQNGFDWDYLLNEARRNGVSPLLHFYQKEEKESFPKKFFEELEKDYYQTLTRNILIWEEIKPILKSLEEKKIEVILLKGIALGVTIYPSPGLRPMSDVDILIKDEDIFKVNEILNRFGYFPGDINPRDIELGKTEYLTTLYYQGKNLSLHLHWHLINSTIPNFSYISKINMDRIWQKARLIEISEIKALILSPEHLIIYLCEHSLRVTHSLSRLIFPADISQAINYYQDKIDWDFLVKESYNFGLERMVYCGLYSANRILRTEVPSNILSSLKPKRLTLGEKIFLSLVAKNRSSPGLSYLVHLAMNKKLSEKIKFLFRTLFPPKKVLGQRNCISPSKINYLHYLSRLKRVLRHVLISISH